VSLTRRFICSKHNDGWPVCQIRGRRCQVGEGNNAPAVFILRVLSYWQGWGSPLSLLFQSDQCTFLCMRASVEKPYHVIPALSAAHSLADWYMARSLLDWRIGGTPLNQSVTSPNPAYEDGRSCGCRQILLGLAGVNWRYPRRKSTPSASETVHEAIAEDVRQDAHARQIRVWREG